jgi:hypothetical protein
MDFGESPDNPGVHRSKLTLFVEVASGFWRSGRMTRHSYSGRIKVLATRPSSPLLVRLGPRNAHLFSNGPGLSSGNREPGGDAARRLKHSDRGDFNRFTVDEVNALLKGGGSGGVRR